MHISLHSLTATAAWSQLSSAHMSSADAAADSLNRRCTPQIKADEDSVIINYSVFANQTANLTDFIMLKACYSNFSEVDRPWRKFNNVIAVSHSSQHTEASLGTAAGCSATSAYWCWYCHRSSMLVVCDDLKTACSRHPNEGMDAAACCSQPRHQCNVICCSWPDRQLFFSVPQESKKCPIVIKTNLDPSKSNATGIVWKPKDTVATATYFVRAFVMHNSSATVAYPVATGVSVGYFQVSAACCFVLCFHFGALYSLAP